MELDLTQLTDEQLEAALKVRQKRKDEEDAAKRLAYENEREELVNELCYEAAGLQQAMEDFHAKALEKMKAFRERTKEYGGIRSNSKGGYSIENKKNDLKVTLAYRTIMGFDERIVMAEELIKEFMGETVKKSSKPIYNLLMGFLEKNKEGKLEPARVMELVKNEKEFDDPRWLKAIKLIKESYSQKDTKYYLDFAHKRESGTWEYVNLSFSSL